MNKFLILLFLLTSATVSKAQNFNLLDPNVPIASHQKRGSRFKIEKYFYLQDFLKRMGAPESSSDKAPEKSPNLAFSYQNWHKITCTSPGPCTPVTSLSSMSPVLLGPVINVRHDGGELWPTGE